MVVLTSFNGLHYKVTLVVNGLPTSGLITASKEHFKAYYERLILKINGTN